MASSKKHQMNILAIIVLIVSVIVIVFLSINSIYFYGLMNGNQPTGGESVFCFATSIVLAIIFLGIAIYCLVKIFKHKAVIYPDEKIQEIQQKTVVVETPKKPEPVKPLPDIPVLNAPPPPKSDITREFETKIATNNSPPPISPNVTGSSIDSTPVQQEFFDVGSSKQQSDLEKLISLQQGVM
jgi:hypothetical protein